jgi:hypothetical protein
VIRVLAPLGHDRASVVPRADELETEVAGRSVGQRIGDHADVDDPRLICHRVGAGSGVGAGGGRGWDTPVGDSP